MALTTDHVKEVLTKITGLPSGLFVETENRVRSGISCMRFECEAEGDEYSILINSKDVIIEVKNSYITYNQQEVEAFINPPPPMPSVAVGGVLNSGLGSLASVASQLMNPPPSAPQNLPPNQPASFGAVALVKQQAISDFKQYVADFVALNPGCIANELSHATVNEADAAVASAWEAELTDFMMDPNGYGNYLKLAATHCADTNIADGISATVHFDTNYVVTSVEIESD